MTAVGIVSHQPVDQLTAVLVAYATGWLMPELFVQYRGIAKRGILQVLGVIAILVTVWNIGSILGHILVAHGMPIGARIFDDGCVGLGIFLIVVATDDLPPSDKSKKTKTSEIVKRLAERITAVHGAPKPIPVGV